SIILIIFFFFSSRRRHTRLQGDWSSDVCSSDLNVYRVDRNGTATVVAGDIPRPNGLAFSPDESKLYVVVSGLVPREIRVFDVVRSEERRVGKECRSRW